MANAQEKPLEWTVNVPLSDLIELVQYQQSKGEVQEELARIRMELSGLRNLYSEVLGVISELRMEIKSR